MPIQNHPFFHCLQESNRFAVFADLADAVGGEGVAPAAAEVAGPEEGFFFIDHLPVHVVVVPVEGSPHVGVGGEELEEGEAVDAVSGPLAL